MPASGSMTMQRCVHACLAGAGMRHGAACCPCADPPLLAGAPTSESGHVAAFAANTTIAVGTIGRRRLLTQPPACWRSAVTTSRCCWSQCRCILLAELQPGAHGGDAHARRRRAQRRARLALGPHEGQDGRSRASQPAGRAGGPQSQSQEEVRCLHASPVAQSAVLLGASGLPLPAQKWFVIGTRAYVCC